MNFCLKKGLVKIIKLFNHKLKRFIVKISIIGLILVFVLKLINLQNNNIKKEKKLEEINKKVEESIKKNQYLKQQINSNMSDSYKEKYARENLDMAKAGERIIFDVTRE